MYLSHFLAPTVPDIVTRLGIDTDCWKETLQRLLSPNKKIGSYFGSSDRLSEEATQRGCKYIKNISGRDIPLHAPDASSLSKIREPSAGGLVARSKQTKYCLTLRTETQVVHRLSTIVITIPRNLHSVFTP